MSLFIYQYINLAVNLRKHANKSKIYYFDFLGLLTHTDIHGRARIHAHPHINLVTHSN